MEETVLRVVGTRKVGVAGARRFLEKPYLSSPSLDEYIMSHEALAGGPSLITRGLASCLIMSNEDL
jgi:hypothetical protein